MECPSCAHPNLPAGKFCIQCGSPLPAACPGCGARLPPGARFCPQCGHDLSTVAAGSASAGTPAVGPARMHCPTCNRERTRIYRVQSEGDPTSRILTRLCKNPACGTIFTTLESLLTVVQSPANKPQMRKITGLLAKLPPSDLAAVQKFLSSLPHVPTRQSSATPKG